MTVVHRPHDTTFPCRERLLQRLSRYERRYPQERALVARFNDLLRTQADCFARNCWPGHITGSTLLLDSTHQRTLLTHHRKLDKWLQLGGHSDGDGDTLQVALREAEEESGLSVRPLYLDILDLDIHEIPARGDDPAHFHFDIRFALEATEGDRFQISDESHDLAWVALAELEDFTREWSVLRLRDKWQCWTNTNDL